jgi:hypothetical protein
MLQLLLELVLPEFDHDIVINTSSTFQYEVQPQKY